MKEKRLRSKRESREKIQKRLEENNIKIDQVTGLPINPDKKRPGESISPHTKGIEETRLKDQSNRFREEAQNTKKRVNRTID
jgi:hypothetical protein